ncbi:MAG TPA: BTAD domain-containing putative transcriptional regulator [Solirubrobacterales bacterium]|jgi:ATP/maltotriose-dependent transcriptional regulator MalT
MAMIIKSKLRIPAPPARVIERSRVDRMLLELVAGHPVVWVSASAGSGKTTAAIEAVRRTDRPAAWLTLDSSDRAPGRLLAYLAAALEPHLDGAVGLVERTLATGTPHAETAGLLADSLPERPLLLVIDQLEQIADAETARAVLSALIRYAPPTLRFLLISRREIDLEFDSLALTGGVAAVGDRQLAFTREEAALALEALDGAAIDPDTAIRVTGGWVTGVLFEAWRSVDHIYGSGGEADPLNGYLARHIMSALTFEERDLLVTTAVMPEVAAADAEALGVQEAGRILAQLRAKHLPVSWQGDVLQAHPRFREYLQTLFGRRNRTDQLRVHRAYAELLSERGELEEATEALLAAGMVDRAAAVGERVIGVVASRGDSEQALRWLAAFRPERVRASAQLSHAELLVAVARERYGDGAELTDRLRELYREEGVPIPSRNAALMAWCYMLTTRFDDGFALLDEAEPGAEVDIARSVLSVERPGGDYGKLAPPSGGPADALLLREHWAHGRLMRLLGPSLSPWVATVNRPWQIAALRALGRLDEALALYEEALEAGWRSSWLTASVFVDLMMDLGRGEEAWRAFEERRPQLLASGSDRIILLTELQEARLALRLDRDLERARKALLRVANHPATEHLMMVSEQLELLQGLVWLREDDARALGSLREAVEMMVAADRILDLPTAAIYLSEAEWRAGDPEAGDRAADLALGAAREQGSYHGMLQALADFPGVAVRRLDSSPGDDVWRQLGRSVLEGDAKPPQVGTVEGRPSLHVGDLGRAVIVVDGAEVRPRLGKSIVLLSFLATLEQPRAPRSRLLEVLFDGRADESTRAYLRQVLNRVREVLPPPFSLDLQGSVVAIDGGRLVSDSTQLLTRLAEAAVIEDATALPTLLEALGRAEELVLLPAIETEWISERRAEIGSAVGHARQRAATLAYEAGEYATADALCRAIVAEDPYREASWRLLMRVRAELGDEDGMVAAYRACQEALGEINAGPAPATEKLLAQLRR